MIDPWLLLRDDAVVFAIVLGIATLVIGGFAGVGKECPYVELPEMPAIPKRRNIVSKTISAERWRNRRLWAMCLLVAFGLFGLVRAPATFYAAAHSHVVFLPFVEHSDDWNGNVWGYPEP